MGKLKKERRGLFRSSINPKMNVEQTISHLETLSLEEAMEYAKNDERVTVRKYIANRELAEDEESEEEESEEEEPEE